MGRMNFVGRNEFKKIAEIESSYELLPPMAKRNNFRWIKAEIDDMNMM